MKLIPFLVAAGVLVGCDGAKIDGDTGYYDSTETGTTTDDTTPGTDDTDTTVTDDTDTDDTDTTTTPGDVTVSNLSWRLHDDYGALVYATWDQVGAATVTVEYSVDDGEWLSSPPLAAVEGANEQLLLGIPYETTASWRVVPSGGEAVDGDPITTEDLPSMPVGSLEIADDANWFDDGKYLLTSIADSDRGWGTSGNFYTYIIDRKGRVVWASRAPDRHWTLFAQVSQDGTHLLWDEATYWSDWDSGRASQVHRTYLDQSIDTIPTPGLHHAFVQMPDGTIAYGSQAHGGGEALALKGLDGSDEEIIWTCDGDWPGVSHCESNGLFYSVERDTFLYSFYTNSSVVEVDHKTGESLWWAGTVRNGYEFIPSNAQFSWQHGISYTETGNLLVSTEYRAGGGGTTTAVIEYEVDHTAETLSAIWSYDSGERADTNGQAWRLDNGNTLHIVGSSGHIKEATPSGDTVWHIDYNDDYLLGQGEFIEDLYALVAPK